MRTRTAGLADVVPEAIGMMDLGAGDLKGVFTLRQVTERELIDVSLVEVVKRTNRWLSLPCPTGTGDRTLSVVPRLTGPMDDNNSLKT